jgi:adenine/guanine phosphoribosyltransferase-like PRPP-binding protein
VGIIVLLAALLAGKTGTTVVVEVKKETVPREVYPYKRGMGEFVFCCLVAPNLTLGNSKIRS